MKKYKKKQNPVSVANNKYDNFEKITFAVVFAPIARPSYEGARLNGNIHFKGFACHLSRRKSYLSDFMKIKQQKKTRRAASPLHAFSFSFVDSTLSTEHTTTLLRTKVVDQLCKPRLCSLFRETFAVDIATRCLRYLAMRSAFSIVRS